MGPRHEGIERLQEPEVEDNFKETVLSRHNSWMNIKTHSNCLHLWIHRNYYQSMHKTCASSSKTKFQHRRYRWALNPSTDQEAIGIWWMLGEKKSVFSNDMTPTPFDWPHSCAAHTPKRSWVIPTGHNEVGVWTHSWMGKEGRVEMMHLGRVEGGR